MKSPLAVLLDAVKTAPNRIAFIVGDRIWTYRAFGAEIERTARAFAAHGVTAGDRVALHMATVPEMAVSVYACFRLGAIAAPVNNRFKAPELEAMLGRLQPALYVGQDHLYPSAAPVTPRVLPMDARFVVGPGAPDDGARAWDALFEREAPALAPFRDDLNAPCLLMSTSGSTGVPKLVAHTGATLAATAEGNDFVSLHPGDTAVINMPMVHASGLYSFFIAIRKGAIPILIERFDPDATLDAVETHRCTMLPGLPFTWWALLERQRTHPRDVSSLRLCVSGGDICPTDLQAQFSHVFGRPLNNVWGMTEVMSATTPGQRPGPVMQVSQTAEIRLVDRNGDDVPDGEPGELLVRDPGLAIGYWSGPGKVERFDAADGGWFATGDVMRKGDGDELWFISRKKDLIVRGGSNIAPAEVEPVLKTHPAVRDAAVLGVADTVLGQRVVALVQLADGADAGVLQAILQDVRPQLADYKLPERLYPVPELPRNATGKIERGALPSLLEACLANA